MGQSFNARWPIGARVDRITEPAGLNRAELLFSPASLIVRLVTDIRASSARPMSFGVRPGIQLGRASCRERVCPYGYISVVAVSLKKKKVKKNYTETKNR